MQLELIFDATCDLLVQILLMAEVAHCNQNFASSHEALRSDRSYDFKLI